MDYTFKDNTYKAVPKDDPKDRIEVEIGDSKQTDFYPQVKLMRWDNEVNFSVRLKDTEYEKAKITTEGDKIKWSKGNIDIEYYDYPEGEGGYKMVWYLKSKPASRFVEFSLQSKGLDFFYQPIYTEEQIKILAEKGILVNKDEKVRGSYAVYTSEQKINWTGGKIYRTGKAGHIYRPKLIDANGWEVWGILYINTEKGIYSVEIPEDFYNNAVYPIKSNDDFGNTNASIDAWYDIDDDIRASAFTSGVAGTGDTMNAYVGAFSSSYYDNMKMAVYLESDLSLKGGTDEKLVNWTRTPGAWTGDIAFVGGDPSIGASTDYYLGGWSGNFIYIATDSVGGWPYGDQNIAYNGWPNPFVPSTGTGRKYSIYATYTPAGAGVVKTVNGLAIASIKTLNGTAVASVKTYNGAAYQ